MGSVSASDAPPPNVNEWAELEIVGSILKVPRLLEYTSGLTSEHFFHQELGVLYEAAATLHMEGKPLDDPAFMASAVGPVAFVGNRLTGGDPTLADAYLRLVRHPVSSSADDIRRLADEVMTLAALRTAGELIGAGADLNDVAAFLEGERELLGQGPFIIRKPLVDRHLVVDRPWIIPKVLLRRQISMIVAPGGTGKSTLAVRIAIALVEGLSWGGLTIKKPFRVLLVHGEDDDAELNRKIKAIGEEVSLTAEQSEAFATVNGEVDMRIAEWDEHGRRLRATLLYYRLVRLVQQHQADVVIVDPFNESWDGDETNAQLRPLANLWRAVATKCNAAVLLIHHTKKYAEGMAGNQDAARGGGSLVNKTRATLTLFPMTEDEAQLHGIPALERRRYVRLDDAKQNYGTVALDGLWFRFDSVAIHDESNSGHLFEVARLVPWKPEGLFSGITNAVINRILDAIETGLTDPDGRPTGERFGIRPNARNWAGKLLMEALGCEELKARTMLAVWKKSGLIQEIDYLDPTQRKERRTYAVDASKRPG